MKSIKIIILSLGLLFINGCKNPSQPVGATITFLEEEKPFTTEQKELIQEIIINSEDEIRALLPQLPDSITVAVEIVDWDLEVVGGVTGRTETNSPPFVAIQISEKYPGGITVAAQTALKHTIFHEFHHLSRGWAIQDNKYGPGINIAAINEGLAVVFSEEYTHQYLETDSPPQEQIAEQWANEILTLPTDANYQHWMFEHPDGRQSIGYRTGNFIIRKAMKISGKNVLELSKNTPDELWKLAGYQR
ncbi:DUF2268 domain-containing putative Zn-dependent protease [Allomuricauda sp. M10]|jgi:Predicted Zn-dependent protease (DUF2268).|uniref:DUF2268 domain-containing putative Zn-dependent protease n=1 Tax=Allomuricauda sp. M10 TaxID=2683292 RepID=UPI001D1885F3|nr:DUF2268 domain-containing putative Zn-dependent protease [Muricauda sp. M10]